MKMRTLVILCLLAPLIGCARYEKIEVGMNFNEAVATIERLGGEECGPGQVGFPIPGTTTPVSQTQLGPCRRGDWWLPTYHIWISFWGDAEVQKLEYVWPDDPDASKTFAGDTRRLVNSVMFDKETRTTSIAKLSAN
jgi:hypothetical protein